MGEETVEINIQNTKKTIGKTLEFFKQRKIQIGLIVISLILILIFGGWIRSQNIPSLKDTSGELTLGPDLDPFLYLRHAEEINNGTLANPDMMRYAPLGSQNYALKNIMPATIFLLFKFMSVFKDTSITYAAIILPVILFLISTLGFFLFNYSIFSIKFSKNLAAITALLASLLYVIMPATLHRTVAGIPEIEGLGLAWLWFALFFFVLAWKNQNKKKQFFYSLLAGILTGIMSWSWGGYRYIYMSIGLASLIFFVLEKDRGKNFLIFSSWIIPALIFEFIRLETLSPMVLRVSDTGFAFLVFFFMIIDFLIFKTKIKEKLKLEKSHIPQSILSLIFGGILLLLLLLIISPSFLLGIFPRLIEGFLYPFGKGRVGATIAENKAPYLTESIQTFGNIFWLFLIGVLLFFWDSLEHIIKKKRIIYSIIFAVLIFGITFTRISSTHLLNGENFISRFLYLGSILFFLAYFIYTFIKLKLNNDEQTLEGIRKIEMGEVLILAFSFFVLISMRGAIRLFFIVSLAVVIFSPFVPVRIAKSLLNKNKDEIARLFLLILFLVSALALIFAGISYYKSTSSEAKATVPGIYEQQWQEAMSWVNDNTPIGSVFVHWWDYGYWVQTIGKRPTVTDGGHFIGYWDHLIGRYVLTTPQPETALSFMKTHNVSYLLIDSTDLGKYGAFSSIGSNAGGNDRFSQIPIMNMDSKQTRESADKETRIYTGGISLDEDIIYNSGGENIFLPAGKAFIGAVMLEFSRDGEKISFSKPYGIFVYNNQQINIPIRYLYFEKKIIDFKGGINATVRVLPQISSGEQGVQMDNLGSLIYLSPKVTDSLFAQLYLMNDPFKRYPTLNIVHLEFNPLIKSLNSQGAGIDDLIYYQGLLGPVKIWKVDYPANITEREEFLRTSGDYAEFDNLTFTR
ncbi:MAG: hypothetical protein NTW17_00885 [Candidatus Pacearchaeota archaeon]|nr:hypothetical protein [Candidatus Pacearchaeota archaeon]